MKIGVNTWVWVSPFSTADYQLLYKIKEMGFDLVEIPIDDPALIDRTKLKQVLHDTGLSVSICGAFGPQRDISNEDAHIRTIGRDYISECIRIAEDLGSSLFAGPVYSAVGKTRMVSQEQKKRERQWCIENMREISQLAADSGVTIGVEPLNRFETDMINLLDQAVELIKEVDSPVYKVHLDTFHSNIEEKNIPDAIRRLGNGMLGHLHACENDRGTPGTGHIDWTGIRDALHEINYTGAAVIESFTPGAVEIAKAASIWRPLAPSQDQLAAEGAVFLKNLFQ